MADKYKFRPAADGLRCSSDSDNATMSFFKACCGLPVEERVRHTRDVALAAPNAPTPLITVTPSELHSLVKWFDDDLRFDNGILRNCGCNGPKYADLIKSGNIPEVTGIEISQCLRECDRDILNRHRDTITSVTLVYFEGINSEHWKENFHADMLWLISSLKDMPRLSFLKIHGYEQSVFPKEFIECLAHLTSLQSLSLFGSFKFGLLPLQCISVEHLTIIEESCTEFECALDLSMLNRLKTVSISTSWRTLILPGQNANMFALCVSEIASFKSVKLPNLTVLRITDCAPSVVEQLLADIDPATLRELSIASKEPIELHREIDARKLEILHLSNIALEYIDTSEETPVKCMSLINSTITTAISGMKFYAVSAYVSYHELRQVNNLCLDRNILKRLGLGREDQTVREMTDLDICALQAVNRFRQNLELFATFAPITTFPEMPRLKYLALFSDAECNCAIGKVPQLVELTRSAFIRQNGGGTSSVTVVIPRASSMQNCFDTFQYWSSHNDDIPYEFLY